MGTSILTEARKVWNKISMEGIVDGVEFDAGLQKNLLDFFHIGKYYFYLFDVMNARFTYISPDIYNVLGHHSEDWDLEMHFSKIHPEDRLVLLDFEKAVVNFFKNLPNEKITKYKFSYDFRIMHANGNYIRIHQQVSTFRFNPDENLLITFGIHTDITDLKKDNKQKLSFIGLDGAPSYIDVDVTKQYCRTKKLFTKRQQEILNLLLSGHQSNEIADILCISKHTVDTHRKNLLAITNCKSNMEMAAKVVREGLI